MLSRTLLHDEPVFPNAFEFRPERYLDEHGKLLSLDKNSDPVLGFGFGRRYETPSKLLYLALLSWLAL